MVMCALVTQQCVALGETLQDGTFDISVVCNEMSSKNLEQGMQ
jgi:hypothetical protein